MNLDFKKTVLGVELGTTRIKAVLINDEHVPIATGSHTWENRLVDGIWTYSLEAIDSGVKACYADLKRDVAEKYGVELKTLGAVGVSAMMHGYMPFDKNGVLLTGFRTWRNTMTGEAAETLTKLFNFKIPQRWCIAHLYQAILNGEAHVKDIACLTTLAGYVHWRLTGNHCVGIGEASGIFPLNCESLDYDNGMIEQFDALAAGRHMPWKLRDVLPRPVPAGMCGGRLTPEGALFLDPTGALESGLPVAPCEGDAVTGMVATNSVRAGTGNVSAGTSAFIMLVSDHKLGVHREVDTVTTPDGLPVAMVHCSNCTSDLNAWINLFAEFAAAIGAPQETSSLYDMLFKMAGSASADGGGLISYNYFSGEGVTAFNEGRPVFARMPGCDFTLANFMRTHLLSALSTLRIGLDILKAEEHIKIDRVYAHGGFFKTPQVGQRIMSAVVGAPVSVMETAGEGGPYGMALLCAYMLWRGEGESLADYLDNRVFVSAKTVTIEAGEAERQGFEMFYRRYVKALKLERVAVEVL